MSSLSQKSIAVIAGGMGYVGRAIATQLSHDGVTIVILYHSSTKESVDSFLTSLGEGHRAYKCDLGNAELVRETIKAIEERQGPVSTYIYAAGVAPSRKPLYQSSSEEVLEAFTKNAQSGFHFFVAAADHLKKRGSGTLIGITSVAAVIPDAATSLGVYVPAKYALQGILATLRAELAPFAIRVYAIAPGFMEGGMNCSFPKAFVEMIKMKSSTGTLASADMVADRVAYLISDTGKEETELTTIIAPELGIV